MSFPVSSKLFPANHKTVFVLDHTPYFGISCESTIEFDFLKSRTPGYIPINPISKSLWTCSVESAIEYCRIVWDLFPTGKLVRFVVSDSTAHILNTWMPVQQNLGYIMNSMSLVGIPPPPAQLRSPQANVEYTIIHGLRSAIEILSEHTDIQHQKKSNPENGSIKLFNKCRVICITSARDNESMNRLEDIFHSVLMQRNNDIESMDRFMRIDHCHLVIINTFPVNIEPQVSNHQLKIISPILSTEVHSIKATLIPHKLSSLILEHYDLASTTVTGIPMKEEQNASSSANYDVEIYHSSDAHTAMLKGNASDSAAIKTVKDGFEYDTVTLKWCTTRGGAAAGELQNCTAMHRITPVDVNSRPSLCLINFLLNGRSVMLEMPRKSGGKITSHLLASHGGEIFIHTLYSARSVLEDPPSISEGCGGRVTDYRITDFGNLIQQNRLYPVKSSYTSDVPIQKMKARLSRLTKYWPLTISSTLIFNLKGCIEPLPAIVTKEKISDDEVIQCKKVIYNLISVETKHEPLLLPNLGQRAKGQKREEQYKVMWNELEMLLKSNLHTENHRSVYNCLLECHKFNIDDDKLDSEHGIIDLDHDAEVPRASVIRATTDSPMSPPPLTSISSIPLSRQPLVSRSAGIYSAPHSLLDIFAMQEKPKARAEFSGRMGDSLVAKLYANLNSKADNDRGHRNEPMEIE